MKRYADIRKEGARKEKERRMRRELEYEIKNANDFWKSGRAVRYLAVACMAGLVAMIIKIFKDLDLDQPFRRKSHPRERPRKSTKVE